MLGITIAILIILAYQGYIREKSIVNFQTIFCLLWGVVCFAASLRLYDMIWFPDDIYIFFLIGCIGFSIGCNLFAPLQRKLSYNNKYILSKNFFNIVYYITTIFMFYFTIKTVTILMSGIPYSEIRSMWGFTDHEDAMITNKFEIFIRNFILMPIIPVFNALLLLHILKIIRISRNDVIKIIFLCALYVFVSGSRIVITNLLIQGILFVFLFNIRLPKKYIRNLILGILLLGMAISTISEYRERERVLVEWNAAKTYYAYCALPVPMFYYHAERADRMDYRSYGMSFFKGAIGLLLYPTSFLGIPRPDAYMEMEKFYQGVSEFVPIFYGIEHNAYVSLFFYFYLDFGIFGIFLGCLFYGAFLKWIYRKTLLHCNLRNILLLLIIFISFSKSFAKWEFQAPDYIMSFIYVFLLTRKTLFIHK